MDPGGEAFLPQRAYHLGRKQEGPEEWRAHKTRAGQNEAGRFLSESYNKWQKSVVAVAEHKQAPTAGCWFLWAVWSTPTIADSKECLLYLTECTLHAAFVWGVQEVTVNTFIGVCSEVMTTGAVAQEWATPGFIFWLSLKPPAWVWDCRCSALSRNFCTCSIIFGDFIQRLRHWSGDLFIAFFAMVAKNCINVSSEVGSHLLKFQKVLQLSSSEIPENWSCPLTLNF